MKIESEFSLSKKVYLDWNIFNKLENIQTISDQEHLIYNFLNEQITNHKLIAPYSNAHLNDLFRGYKKDPSYTPGHLQNITRLTNNLCLAQYWGEKDVRWHIRDPESFIKEKIEEEDIAPLSFLDLFLSLDDPLLESAWELKKLSLMLTPIPNDFKKLYAIDPVFTLMYPRTKEQMTLLALCEDIYEFSYKVKSDFALYKNFKKFIIDGKNKFPQYKNVFNNAETKVIGNPKYLSWDTMFDELPQYNSSANLNYNSILTLFTRTDLKGYRQDEKFANMIDDALHCFYAAHCDFFITLDSRCYDKTKLVYEKLKIATRVFTPLEFKEWHDQKND